METTLSANRAIQLLSFSPVHKEWEKKGKNEVPAVHSTVFVFVFYQEKVPFVYVGIPEHKQSQDSIKGALHLQVIFLTEERM